MEETNLNFVKFSMSGILDDSHALCMACKQTLSSLFFLMDAYREELDYTVLSNLISVMFSSKISSPCSFKLLCRTMVFFFFFDFFHLLQVCCKVATIAADATPELSDDIKQFFINLLQYSAALVFLPLFYA